MLDYISVYMDSVKKNLIYSFGLISHVWGFFLCAYLRDNLKACLLLVQLAEKLTPSPEVEPGPVAVTSQSGLAAHCGSCALAH